MAGLVVSGTQVSYIGQDCREIPEHLGRDCGHFAKRLDLSFNLLSTRLPWCVKKIPWRRIWYACLGNPTDRRTWWTTILGVTKSRT
ncbi:unnamed protein product [Rangifer tarandus platyrhynchus]|uniref:Uncharacterized protein n=1 Tax=Rangifer tarandus platyrhynchus TaxID=3082113 RepID=A0ABN9A171_RANTA|nr:unnamed protein product [Rangifer tarandus platyrhynchus]